MRILRASSIAARIILALLFLVTLFVSVFVLFDLNENLLCYFPCTFICIYFINVLITAFTNKVLFVLFVIFYSLLIFAFYFPQIFLKSVKKFYIRLAIFIVFSTILLFDAFVFFRLNAGSGNAAFPAIVYLTVYDRISHKK